MIATSDPRTLDISGSESASTSLPFSTTSPPTICPGGEGINLMIERDVTDLPDPDSPTIPMVSPALREKLTPSTAFTVPQRVSKYVLRSRTSSTFSFRTVSGPNRSSCTPLCSVAAAGSVTPVVSAICAPYQWLQCSISGFVQHTVPSLDGNYAVWPQTEPSADWDEVYTTLVSI